MVPNASVTVRNIATNLTRTTTAADNGTYRISQLPPGTYEVKASGTNFKTSLISDVVAAVGQVLPLDIHLEIGVPDETVTVVGAVKRRSSELTTLFREWSIRDRQNLPLNGRNFLDLAQLQPGVERVEGGSFDPTKVNYHISIAGQAGRSTQIAVDGASVVDNVVGTTTQNFSQEIVQEFQLGISNFELSTGASSTGSVNVISRSVQTNSTATVTSTPAVTAGPRSRSRASTPPTVFQRARGRPKSHSTVNSLAALGGPIRKDKLFFFTNYEYNNQDGSSIHLPLIAPSFAGFTTSPFNETLFTKVDWNMSSKMNSYFRYSFNDNDNNVPFPPGTGIVPRPSPAGSSSQTIR